MSRAERVVIVHLRRPSRTNPNESRTDPFWEVGSFGCTGCHRKNLMNPRRADSLNGVRLAFAQGGPLGFRLVHLTPPVKIVRLPDRCEATWSPAEMPFRYDTAPLLINNLGDTDFPKLRTTLNGGLRKTKEGQFSSQFRSRREPLDLEVGAELVSGFVELRENAPADSRARTYVDALPYLPPKIETDRHAVYRELRSKLLQPPAPSGPKLKGSRPSTRRC